MIWIALFLAAVLFGLKWLAITLRFMANCDERDDTYFDPDPKPIKRRAF